MMVVLVTCSSIDEARTIAHAVVSERLAACCNLVDGVQSVYRWDGQVQEGREVLMVIKTTREQYDLLETRVQALHSYDVPEVVALPVIAGLAEYMAWVASSVR